MNKKIIIGLLVSLKLIANVNDPSNSFLARDAVDKPLVRAAVGFIQKHSATWSAEKYMDMLYRIQFGRNIECPDLNGPAADERSTPIRRVLTAQEEEDLRLFNIKRRYIDAIDEESFGLGGELEQPRRPQPPARDLSVLDSSYSDDD